MYQLPAVLWNIMKQLPVTSHQTVTMVVLLIVPVKLQLELKVL